MKVVTTFCVLTVQGDYSKGIFSTMDIAQKFIEQCTPKGTTKSLYAKQVDTFICENISDNDKLPIYKKVYKVVQDLSVVEKELLFEILCDTTGVATTTTFGEQYIIDNA